jgi:intein/homing endonuclease
MTIVARHKWEWDEVCGVVTLLDPLLFALAYWEEDFTIPHSRTDLPKKWRGKQIISKEQRMMFYDGCVYRLWRDVLPDAAQESSQKVAMRTSRKIGKTLYMESQLIQIAITNTVPGVSEGMFHTPRDNHMSPVINRTVKKIKSTPLFALVFKTFDAASGIMNWRTGWIWHTRIEGMCIGGDALIQDAITGEQFEIGEIIGGYRPRAIHTINADTYERTATSEFDVVESGKRELFSVVSEDNYSVKATANHPFLTPDGWRRLDSLKPGDLVAVTGNLPANGLSGLSCDQARLLGYFVGDGCTVGGMPMFINNDPGVIEDWRNLCEAYPNIRVRALQEFQYSASGERGTRHSKLIQFLRDHGVWGKRADLKRVPLDIFRSTPDVVASFLSGLISCDGSVAFKKNGSVVISFASINRDLVEDVAYLLLRFGVKTRLEYKKADDVRAFGGRIGKSKELWSLRLSGMNDLARFCENIHLVGRKAERQGIVLNSILPGRQMEGGHGLVIPGSIVAGEMAKAPCMSMEGMRKLTGLRFHNFDRGVRYATVAGINKVLASPVLENLLKYEVLWVKVKSITSVGVEQTYDLRVPGTRSFIGNQYILHNSGTGSNMVGLRASVMMGDEGDYSQSAPYIEREQTALPGCAQLWGGVPRGVRGEFWRICNTSAGKEWSIHRYDIRANALYHSQKAFGDQVKEDWYSQRVQTQVLGRDGEESVSSFPLVPVDAGSPYVIRKFSLAEYMKFKDGLPTFLNIPVGRVEDAVAWIIHFDYGYSPSPTQIGISYYRAGMWHLLCRIETLRIDTAPMANIIAAIDTGVLPKRAALIVMDAHGQGRGVLSALQTDERWDQEDYANRALSVSFEGSTQIPDIKVHRKCRQAVRRDRQEEAYVCDTCHIMIYDDRELTDATRQTKAYLTDELKEAFSNAARVMASNGKEWTGGVAIAIGDDAELVEELAGTTEVTSVTGQTRYNTPRDADHMTDMLRCLVSAAERYISLTSEWDQFKPSDYGWGENFAGPALSGSRNVSADNWLPPWAAAAQQKGW